ncbi:hypothetical protein FRC00_006526 [Tulasnella sp. 408]|nr:hypothetical protein FRC00_006526 [Tulasnella sp. 408]
MPVLQTLELSASPWMEDESSEPLGNLPSIRHLGAKWWEPPTDAVWLRDLKELVFWRHQKSITEVLQLLSACASLEQLEIYSMDEVVARELPGAIPAVTLPRLRSICLNFKSDESGVTLIRRLIAPQCLERTLRVEHALHLGLYLADYQRFMSLEDEGIRQYPGSAVVNVECSWFGTLIEYQTETCKVSLDALRASEVPAFHNLVQEFQKLLKGPSLTLTIKYPTEDTWLFFKSLSNQNVQTIEAYGNQFSDTSDLLEAIGADPPDLPSQDGSVANSTTDRPFKSLSHIYIHDTRVELVDFTRKVEEYLHKDFKPLLEKIVFVNCRFDGMELAQAAERLVEIGIALQATERHGG